MKTHFNLFDKCAGIKAAFNNLVLSFNPNLNRGIDQSCKNSIKTVDNTFCGGVRFITW